MQDDTLKENGVSPRCLRALGACHVEQYGRVIAFDGPATSCSRDRVSAV